MNSKIKTKLNEKLSPKTKLILLTSATIIFLIITTIIMIKDRIYNATIDLLIAPASSNIEIDGQKYVNGKHRIASGKHVVKISKEGFDSKEEEIEIQKDETYIYYEYLLQPENSMDWYKDHEEDSLLLETIIPALSEKNLKKLQEQYPLLKQLPINEDYYINNYAKHIKYSISYKTNNDKITILITSYTKDSATYAQEKIKTLGFNLNDYIIKYEIIDESDGWGKAE